MFQYPSLFILEIMYCYVEILQDHAKRITNAIFTADIKNRQDGVLSVVDNLML